MSVTKPELTYKINPNLSLHIVRVGKWNETYVYKVKSTKGEWMTVGYPSAPIVLLHAKRLTKEQFSELMKQRFALVTKLGLHDDVSHLWFDASKAYKLDPTSIIGVKSDVVTTKMIYGNYICDNKHTFESIGEYGSTVFVKEGKLICPKCGARIRKR